MADDLDPQLERWFAAAEQDLTDTEFRARIAAAHRRQRALLAPLRIGAAVWRGIATAAAPPRLHPGLTAILAAVAAAITLGLALQG
ncbi:MAG: hypothetical protein ABSG29_01245 [Steroidobacteraceae bacterium]|jgi:hypothetical protein